MRLLIAAIAFAAVVSGCAAPAPTRVPTTLEPSHGSAPPTAASTLSPTPLPTPASTDPPLPTATITAFGAPYPDPGWAVAAAFDASGDIQRAITYGRVKAGALLDFAYTCEHSATISVQLSGGGPTAPGDSLWGFETACLPGQVGRVTLPSTSATMFISLAATADPEVRFWVKLGVPTDHFLK